MPHRIQATILIAADDGFLRERYVTDLRAEGYDTQGCTIDGLEATLSQRAVRVVVIDLPAHTQTVPLLRTATRIQPSALIVLGIEPGDAGTAMTALRSGAVDYLIKPVESEMLKMIVRRVLENDRLLMENLELRGYVDLYRACQRIITQLDAVGVRAAILEALVAETGARAGLYLHWPSIANPPRLRDHLGLENNEAENCLKELQLVLRQDDAYSQPVHTVSLTERLPQESPLLQAGYEEMIVVSLQTDSQIFGVCVILRHRLDGAWKPKAAEDARFIARHAALAWQNVELYTSAQNMAYQDTLTGLYNSRYLLLSIEQEISRHGQSQAPFAVLFLDLDYFKNINDTYGHLTGSQLLIEVSRVLRRCVRDEDVVVRYGGDEFAVLLKGTSLPLAGQIAERTRKILEEHTFLGRERRHVHITACIGVAAFPGHAQKPEQLVFLADRAMYRGKASTRNMVVVADPEDLKKEEVVLRQL